MSHMAQYARWGWDTPHNSARDRLRPAVTCNTPRAVTTPHPCGEIRNGRVGRHACVDMTTLTPGKTFITSSKTLITSSKSGKQAPGNKLREASSGKQAPLELVIKHRKTSSTGACYQAPEFYPPPCARWPGTLGSWHLVGWRLLLGFGLDGRLLLARRGRVCV